MLTKLHVGSRDAVSDDLGEFQGPFSREVRAIGRIGAQEALRTPPF